MRKFLALANAVARLAVVWAVGGGWGAVARAYTTNVNGVTWTYSVVDGTASVCGNFPLWGSFSPTIDRETSGAISIPSSLAGYPVTDIGEQAFYECYKLTSVAIPESVTGIGSGAFENCTGLTNVPIPESVTGIGSSAFSNCYNLTSVTILGNVNTDYSYGSSLFGGCSNLETVVWGDKVTEIGSCMFLGCSGLANVTVPENVTSLAESAFIGTGLRQVTILGNVTNDWCWLNGPFRWGTTNLATVVLGDKMTKIGERMFYECSGLTNVIIGNGVTNIGVYAFIVARDWRR